VSTANKEGKTPLYIAAENDHAAIVEMLVTAGATWSYLTAAKDGNVEAIQELIAGGQMDINQTNNKGETPLYIAAEKGSTEIAALLIEAKVRSVCVGGEVKQ
jgi:ankyrin repeat protein